jgi:hypothetical protein
MEGPRKPDRLRLSQCEAGAAAATCEPVRFGRKIGFMKTIGRCIRT